MLDRYAAFLGGFIGINGAVERPMVRIGASSTRNEDIFGMRASSNDAKELFAVSPRASEGNLAYFNRQHFRFTITLRTNAIFRRLTFIIAGANPVFGFSDDERRPTNQTIKCI